MKNIKALIILSLFLGIFTYSFSATLTLTQIGALSTDGNVYSEWWYMGRSPLLEGTAEANSEVSVTVGETSNTVTADDSGNWSYQTDISDGDHSISISQGEENISFTLHMGQTMPSGSETAESTTAVPVTGFNQIIGISLGLATILFATYLYISDNNKKRFFEQKMLQE